MLRRMQRNVRELLAAGVLGAALCMAAGCKTIHEEVAPIRETTLTVARSGGDVTLSWIGMPGMFYTVMFTDARGARAQWKLLPDAINIRGMVTGEAMVVHDRLPATQPRYYRLHQGAKPLVP